MRAWCVRATLALRLLVLLLLLLLLQLLLPMQQQSLMPLCCPLMLRQPLLMLLFRLPGGRAMIATPDSSTSSPTSSR